MGKGEGGGEKWGVKRHSIICGMKQIRHGRCEVIFQIGR